MWPVIVVPVVISTLAVVLRSMASDAEKQVSHMREEVERTESACRARMKQSYQEKSTYVLYKKLVAEHHESVLRGNQAHRAYRESVISLQACRAAIHNARKQARLAGCAKEARDYLNQMAAGVRALESDMEALRERLQAVNHRTHALKEQIRTQTGAYGRRWYERGQARRLARME